MTEHTRESDEMLLIAFVLEIAGIDQQYLVDAANRLQEEVESGGAIQVSGLVDR